MAESPATNPTLLTGSKFLDFIVGLFGTYAVGTVSTSVLTPIVMMLLPINSVAVNNISSFVFLAFFLIELAFYIWMIRYVFKKGYKVVGYGMITAIILPLLLFGACLGVLSTMHF